MQWKLCSLKAINAQLQSCVATWMNGLKQQPNEQRRTSLELEKSDHCTQRSCQMEAPSVPGPQTCSPRCCHVCYCFSFLQWRECSFSHLSYALDPFSFRSQPTFLMGAPFSPRVPISAVICLQLVSLPKRWLLQGWYPICRDHPIWPGFQRASAHGRGSVTAVIWVMHGPTLPRLGMWHLATILLFPGFPSLHLWWSSLPEFQDSLVSGTGPCAYYPEC